MGSCLRNNARRGPRPDGPSNVGRGLDAIYEAPLYSRFISRWAFGDGNPRFRGRPSRGMTRWVSKLAT